MNTFIFERSDTFRTRKTKRWFALLSFCLMLFMGQTGFAQVSYSQGFPTNAASWTTTGGYSGATGWTSVRYCTAAGAMRINVYTTGTSGTIVSPLLGVSVETPLLLSYGYKVPNYNSDTASPAVFVTVT